MYASAPAQGSHLALRLSEARAKQAQLEEVSSPFLRNLYYLVPASLSIWSFLLFARWRYREDRLRALEQRPLGALAVDLLAWRFTAHLGPYQVPNLCDAKMYEEPLRMLQESVMLDHEREGALRRLGRLTYRPLAAQRLESPDGQGAMKAMEPLLRDVLGQVGERLPGRSTESQRARASELILDVVAACPAEERAVPPWVLSGVVKVKGTPWQSGVQGEELRATVLLQLLRTPSNAAAAARLPEVCEYLSRPGLKRKEDTAWPVKAYLCSAETHDLLRKGARLVSKQCPEGLQAQPKRSRDTPSLQIKRDLRNLWTTLLLTAGWSGVQHFTGVYTVQATLQTAYGIAGALAGTALLESLWRVEEQVIESEWYWQDGTLASAGMLVANCCALAWAMRFSCIVPFLICRLFKDDYLDAHRSFT